MALTPFRLAVPDSELENLRERLRRTRWPEGIAPRSAWCGVRHPVRNPRPSTG